MTSLRPAPRVWGICIDARCIGPTTYANAVVASAVWCGVVRWVRCGGWLATLHPIMFSTKLQLLCVVLHLCCSCAAVVRACVRACALAWGFHSVGRYSLPVKIDDRDGPHTWTCT